MLCSQLSRPPDRFRPLELAGRQWVAESHAHELGASLQKMTGRHAADGVTPEQADSFGTLLLFV